MKRSPEFEARFWTGLVTVVVVLLGWIFGHQSGFIDAQAFPRPEQFLAALKQLSLLGYADGLLHSHMVQSFKLILMGFFSAVCIGVPLGLLMGWSRRWEALINPVFLLLRPIPALAWIPLAIVWLGLDDAAKVMILWVAAFVPSVINTYSGVRTLDRTVIEAARMLGVSAWSMMAEVVIPGAMPAIFTGLRLSLQACLTALVAAELLGAVLGMGKVLYQGGLDIYPAMILVGMVVVAIAGLALTFVLDGIERWSMPWRQN